MPIDFHAAKNHRSYIGREADFSWHAMMSALTTRIPFLVVDIGCGGGIYTKAWADFGANRVTGIDGSRVMIADAKENCAGYSNISFAVGDAARTGLSAGLADIVYERALVHHLQRLEPATREAYRLLKDRGMYLIQDRTIENVSLPGSPDHIRGYLFELYPHLQLIESARRPSSNDVCSALQEAGFGIVFELPFWETRTTYDSIEPLCHELLARKGRSILHELTDEQLHRYIALLRDRLPESGPIQERDQWTVWKAVKPSLNFNQPFMNIRIANFGASDQAAARMLILTGLGEHFGFIDYSMNPDLDDIQQNYIEHGHTFLVAKLHGEVVATGALKDGGDGTGRLVRISVKQSLRRSGIGSQMVRLLLREALLRQYRSVYLTTIPAWKDAIGLYQSLDFRTTELTEQHIRMELALSTN